MADDIRVRFAPSPTGNVHIGNIRVAIFNWLFARHHEGSFLLRVEDTDRERSTPEAIATLFSALEWLGLDYDEPPVHQSAQFPRHEAAAQRLQNLDLAYQNSDPAPAVVLKISRDLFDPSFVTAPGAEAAIETGKAHALRATLRSLVIIDRQETTGREFVRPVPWDAIEAGLTLHLAGGGSVEGAPVLEAVREKCGPNPSEEISCDLNELAEARVERVSFRRRHVVVEDLILGRRQKALDDLRDFVIVRGDGSPVFHLANVVDDATMGITHVLRGNDHLENTFRHLFLYKAIGHEPPAFGHFPMIVNEQGKPYSKRDGDAYVGDFREAGILPEALFNFLALCGWSPGDDREKMSRREMAAAFRLEQVNDAPAQFNREKLEWLNARYLLEASDEELRPHYETAIRGAGGQPEGYEDAWWSRLIAAHRERLKTLAEIAPKTLFFFSDTVSIDWENKKVRKVFKKPEARAVLADLRQRLADLEMAWTEEAIEAAVAACAEERGLKMGAVAQPLRVAATGGTASPGIGETLFLIGRERTLKRLDRALAELPAAEESSP